MSHELKCNKCDFEFSIDEDYQFGKCPNCNVGYYYWDYVLDDETYEEFFAGYYWEK